MSSIIKVDTIQTAAGGTPTAADLGLNTTGSVVQTHHFSYTPGSTYQTNSASFTDVTGVSTTFTPSSADGFLLIQAVFPCEMYTPTGSDVHSYSALHDSILGRLIQVAGQGDNLGKLGDIVWLPQVHVHTYKLTHGSTVQRTFKIQVANASTSRNIRFRTEHTAQIQVMEIAG